MTTTTSNEYISPFKQNYKIIKAGTYKFTDGPWLVIYDQKLPAPKKYLKGDLRFLGIRGGEGVKTFRAFEKLLGQISKLEDKSGPFIGFCIVGGGSVGDAGAFAASVYRRGVRLVQVPSTPLAVIDSAFGGKSALNFAGAKNQIGTFYPAEKVLIFSQLLPKNPVRIHDAFAEILKMAILERRLWKKVQRVKKPDLASFWALAKTTIDAKLDIVARDPFERNGQRRLLNLGHTLGHLFEKLSAMSHGEAVALGLFCEIEISYLLGRMSDDEFFDILEVWERFFDFKKLLAKLGVHSRAKAGAILAKDKKVAGTFVHTAIVSGVGEVRIEKISLKSLLYYLHEQGIVKS